MQSPLKEESKKLLAGILLMLSLVAWNTGGDRSSGRLLRRTIPAPSLAGNLISTPARQPLIVYLPPSYHGSDRDYPVIYYLPGFTTDVHEMIDGTFQGLNIQTDMDDLLAAGRIAEMIFVVANGRNFLGGSFYVNSPVTGNWEDFIARDVVQFIDRTYRTRPRSDSRGIAGSSMGGFGAIHLAMRHPDVFGAVYSLSPGLFDENGLNDQGMFGSTETIKRYLEKQSEFDALPRVDALKAFKAFIAELYGTPSSTHLSLAFSYAYGAAFSPAPGRGVPYIDYPYTLCDTGLQCHERARQNYIRGFGGLFEKVQRYRDNLLKLNGLRIDIGVNDPYGWIVRGSRYLSRRLKAERISHRLQEHKGGHEDRLRDRVENHMLPFFSRVLAGHAITHRPNSRDTATPPGMDHSTGGRSIGPVPDSGRPGHDDTHIPCVRYCHASHTSV